MSDDKLNAILAMYQEGKLDATVYPESQDPDAWCWGVVGRDRRWAKLRFKPATREIQQGSVEGLYANKRLARDAVDAELDGSQPTARERPPEDWYEALVTKCKWTEWEEIPTGPKGQRDPRQLALVPSVTKSNLNSKHVPGPRPLARHPIKGGYTFCCQPLHLPKERQTAHPIYFIREQVGLRDGGLKLRDTVVGTKRAKAFCASAETHHLGTVEAQAWDIDPR